MTSNLVKSPLIAIFFGGLLYFSGVFTPYSDTYKEMLGGFSMPVTGYIFIIAFALWITITAAVAFGLAGKGGMKFIISFSLPVIFSAWGVPVVQPLLFGAGAGIPETPDALVIAGIQSVCTILAITLFVIVFKAKEPEKQVVKTSETVYKLKPADLIIKLLVLPLIYTVLFFAAWYFLHWNNAEVREFYGGMPENPGFVPSVVNVLLYDAWMLTLALLKGLLYSLLALPLLFIMPGKKIGYIVLTVMINLTGTIWMLVPSPVMPDNIRMSNVIYNAALLFVFSIICGVLLNLSFRREEKAAVHQNPPMTAQQQALAAAKAKAAAGPTAKRAAEVVSNTLAGK